MAHDQAVGEGHLGRHDRLIERADVRVLELATEGGPESDGTLVWRSTTMVLCELRAGGVTGLGWTYEDAGSAHVIEAVIAPAIRGLDAWAIPQVAARMAAAVRNQGVPGVSAAAISAVDIALWDLKASMLGVPLADLLGAAREEVPTYYSGGFTSQTLDQLEDELARAVAAGHRRVKIKVGRHPAVDLDRVERARAVIGPAVELMVDGNGAYRPKVALAMAEAFARHDVAYFEEPVPMTDLEGLRFVRDRAPLGMEIASGEYGYRADDFARLLDVVDILQADATRCQGITGFLRCDALAAARGRPLSAHCAPSIHLHAGAAASQLLHVEMFRDHVRFEGLVFEGAAVAEHGALKVARDRPGLGLRLRKAEADRLVH